MDERLTADLDVNPNSMGCMNAIRLDLTEGEYPFQTAVAFGFKYFKIAAVSGEFTVEGFRVLELTCPEKIKVD